MDFLDKIKQQATEVATTVVEKTQEAAKTGQAQRAASEWEHSSTLMTITHYFTRWVDQSP